jgi:hypothetical protein
VFWLEPAEMSRAESAVYAVRLSRNTLKNKELILTPEFVTGLSCRHDALSNVLQVAFLQPDEGFSTIELLDEKGRVILAFEGEQMEGYYTVDFDLAGLPSGKYVVRLTCNGLVAERPVQW